MLKNRGSPPRARDFEVSLLIDLSFPLLITYQLFWFSEKIPEFLAKHKFFQSTNGIIIGALNDFTYERAKMEGGESVYLLGFGSNIKSECYKQLKILCMSEEEKLALNEQIITAIHELVDAVQSNENGSSYMIWPIDQE